MHGLINRSIESFVTDTYGQSVWNDATLLANIGFDSFEALLPYDDKLTLHLLDAIAARLERPVETVLEDLGTYLVSHPSLERLRRLLRFGGRNFAEFLFSLDDLRDRARLAVPDLDIPQLEVSAQGGGVYYVYSTWGVDGFGHVLVGILRAMADDYGDLIFLDHEGSANQREVLKITVVANEFSDGRDFHLLDRNERSSHG